MSVISILLACSPVALRKGATSLLAACLFMSPPLVAAEQESTTYERDQLWALLRHSSEQIHELLAAPPARTSFAPVQCDGESPRQYLAEALRSEAEKRDSDRGFTLNGFYTGGTVKDGTDSDIVSENGDRGRGFLELSWELLDGGYLGNNQEAALLRSRAELEALLADDDATALRLRCQRDQVHRLFAPLRLDIQSLLLQLLKPVYDYERRAYFKGSSYLDEFLVSERDLLLARREVDYLSSFVREDSSRLPPIIDIDISALMEAIDRDDSYQRARQLEDDITRARYEAEERNRLRLFLRQEIDGNGSPQDVVAGVRFSIPLGAPGSVALEERRRYHAASASLAGTERSALVRSSYLEVREQLQRVIDSYYAFTRSAERVRRSLAEYRLYENGSLAVAVTRVKSLLNSADTAASAQEVLYRRVFETLTHARIPFEDKFLSFVPLSPEMRARTGHRALYLWSSEFNNTSNDLLLDLAAAKRIDRFSISAGRQTDFDKLKLLLREQRRPQVELLMGDVAWLNPAVFKRVRDRILGRIEMIGPVADIALHLDVEPQQSPAYAENRSALLDQYLQLMVGIRRALPRDMGLHISVPAHWPEALYGELALVADEISIMAYGLSRAAGLKKAMSLAQAIPMHKLRWVLRAGDFQDDFAMESYLRELEREVGIRRFAIHGYADWLALPRDPA